MIRKYVMWRFLRRMWLVWRCFCLIFGPILEVLKFLIRVLSSIVVMLRKRFSGLKFVLKRNVHGTWGLNFIWVMILWYVRRMVALVVRLLLRLLLALKWLRSLLELLKRLFRLNFRVVRNFRLSTWVLRFMFLRLVLCLKRLLIRLVRLLVPRMWMTRLLIRSRCLVRLEPFTLDRSTKWLVRVRFVLVALSLVANVRYRHIRKLRCKSPTLLTLQIFVYRRCRIVTLVMTCLASDNLVLLWLLLLDAMRPVLRLLVLVNLLVTRPL